MEALVSASSTPTITSGSAYATGNNIGGLLTFKNIVPGGCSAIYSVTIIDASGQNTPIDLFLFASPVAAPTDKAAIALSAADAAKCIGVVSFAATDYKGVGTPSVAGLAGASPAKAGLFIGAIGDTDNNLYGVMVARGAGTYTSTTALTVRIVAEGTRSAA